jgi:ribosomal protein S18 acetylase RimI-like enzyme
VRLTGRGALKALRRHIARRERLYVFHMEADAIDAWEDDEPEGISTRPIVPADAQALAHVLPPHETLRQLAAGDLGTLAIADGRVVGCAWLATRPMPAFHHLIAVRPAPGEAYGYGLWVDPDARLRGVGRALVREGRVRGRALGVRRVITHVEFSNRASVALQRSLGTPARRRLYAIVLLDRFSLVLRSGTPQPS